MKYRILCFISALLLLLTCCSSCSNENVNVKELAVRGGRCNIYDGILYSFNGSTINYVDCEDETTPIPLCSDSLCSHTGEFCPAYFPDYSRRLMLIKPSESDKNSKFPIVYISCCYGEYDRIIRFDTKTNQKDIIVNDIPERVQSLWAYDNLLYYTVSDAENQLNIKAVNPDDKSTYELKNDGELRFYIGGIDEEYIFFTDYDGNIYRAPHDLSSKEQIGSSVTCGKVYVYADKIFYFSDIRTGATVNGMNFLACDLYSMDKNDINAAPTVVLENVSYIGVPVMYQYENTLFYCLCQNITAEGSKEVYHSYEEETSTVDLYDDGTSTIYTYDILTGESRTIVENSKYNIGLLYTADDRYFVYGGFEYNPDELSEHGRKTCTIIVDCKENKQYIYY